MQNENQSKTIDSRPGRVSQSNQIDVLAVKHQGVQNAQPNLRTDLPDQNSEDWIPTRADIGPVEDTSANSLALRRSTALLAASPAPVACIPSVVKGSLAAKDSHTKEEILQSHQDIGSVTAHSKATFSSS